MAQRTGITPPSGPPRRLVEPQANPDTAEWQVEAPGGATFPPVAPEDDLGLRPTEPYRADPTGFQPSSKQTIDVAGRAGIPLSTKDLEELHYSHAGTKPMVNDPGSLMDRHLNLTEEEQQARAEEVARRREYDRQRQRQDQGRAQEVKQLEDELLDGYQQNDQPAGPASTTGPALPPTAAAYFGGASETPSSQPESSTVLTNITDVGETGKLLEGLVAKASEARSRGDIKLATELNGMIQQILVASNLRRSQPKKDRHPALQKLLSNLGLERIKPINIEWLETKWRFAPRPEALDWWVAEHMGEGGIELNHAIIAATLVGMDDAPLYEVLNIPLSAEYTITRNPTKDDIGGETTVTVAAYTKICDSCGVEVSLDARSCIICSAFLDHFEVPLELRFRYADLAKKLLLEKLCLSTEQLGHLVGLLKAQLKDRRLDQAEVFPLTQLLPKPQRTTG